MSLCAQGRQLAASFRVGRLWLPLGVAIAIHVLMAVNAAFHPPAVNYDGRAHLRNLELYSELRLPTPAESHEFFSPPLPYLVPAPARILGLVGVHGLHKLAQLLNVLYSAAAFAVLLVMVRRRWPDQSLTLAWAFALLGFLPVWPKSFAFVRGEPLLALVTLVAAHQATLLAEDDRPPLRRGVGLGLAFAAVALSRQWGFFAIAGLVLVLALDALRARRGAARKLTALATALATCAAGAGWFYLHLRSLEGSAAAFNRSAVESFSLANQPREFYLGLGLPAVFSDPIRPAFTNQLLPTFYSELWGDYQCYFLVYGRDRASGAYVAGKALQKELATPGWELRFDTNRFTINHYLGRAQLLALLPTAVLLGGVLLGLRRSWQWISSRKQRSQPPFEVMATAIVVVSFVGYMWFLLMYPAPEKGDTIKATYMLHTYPFLAAVGAAFLAWLRRRWPRAGAVLMIATAAVLLHNIGLLLSRYASLP